MQLSGKVVVVTGAFGQLGRAVTREVLAQGARAALVDVSASPADLPAGTAAFQADLRDLADGTRAIDAAAERFGRIDGLVNVAGGFRWQPLAGSTDAAEWQAMFDLNLRTCVHASKAVLPHLQRAGAGRIVNIGAGAAGKAAAGMGAYAASKAGVARLTEALAEELKLQRITVNAVLPSIIDTPQNRADMPKADFERWVKAADIARVIGFLLSDAAEAVTGASIPVTGRT